jgi:hypothetical protein
MTRAERWRQVRRNFPVMLATVALTFGMHELGAWSVERQHAATPRILSGRAQALTDDNRLACCSSDPLSEGGEVFSVASVRWRDLASSDNSWHDEGVPGCLSRTETNVVRMGVVQIKNRGGGPAIDVAGWVECRRS